MAKKEKKLVVVITGTSSGIGRDTAKYFYEMGHTVYGLARTVTEEDFFTTVCDVTNSSDVERCFAQIYLTEGHIDVLINNAGIGVSGAVEYIDKADTQKMIDVNINAVVDCAKQVVPYMRLSGGGKIINISSVAAVVPIPFQSLYSASKSAINVFSNALRLELLPFNIFVSAVMLGDTKTGFTANRQKFDTDEGYENRLNKSVSKMEIDEQKGNSPEKVAKELYKLATKKRPKAIKTVGFGYKTAVLLAKILPNRFMLFVVKKLYG